MLFRSKNASSQTAYLTDLENRLRTRLATKVTVKARKKGGVIEIDYYSEDELDRLSGLLTGE